MYIGSSSAAQALRSKIDKIKCSNAAVLITGETGVGKGVVARALHGDCPGPFIKIDCASLVPTLVESELQGHVRGAFTGADSARQGLFASANGGSLFLDEVGELAAEMQAKFLTLLQDREVRPVGSVRSQPFSCRLISATNRDLRADMEHGRFRRDLFYRLKVVEIRVPPLREHIQDVPELVRRFLDLHASPDFTIRDEVLVRFMKYQWPGNIRELENSIQAMCALANGSSLGLTDIPSQFVSREVCEPGTGLRQVHAPNIDNEVLLETIRTTGSKARAARLLRIGRSTLYRRLGAC